MQYILFEKKKSTGIIILNRPQALNALNADMVEQLHEKLTWWETQPDIHDILILSNNNKAFCAGGDIREVYTAYQKKVHDIKSCFKREYELNAVIKNYQKPYTAIMNGITMGGGVGITIHGHLRIAAHNLIWAMPETGIGFFPDAGASYFLPRCPGQLGTYIGLTGARLNATEALYADLIDQIIGEPPEINTLKTYQEIINRCFSPNTIEEILAALRAENHPWAADIHALLLKKSPTSLKLTLYALRKGAEQDFNSCMDMEYQLAGYCLDNHDFMEGIRAAVIDKDHTPRWHPAQLEEVDIPFLIKT